MMLRTMSTVQSPSGDGNRAQSGFGKVQVEGEASAQGVKRRAEALLQRDSDARVRSSTEPIPNSGMHMQKIVTIEQCEQRIQTVLKDLVSVDLGNFVEDSPWYGLELDGYVFDVTTMNLSDDHVQSKCGMMLNGQKPMLLLGESKCAKSGELNEDPNVLQCVVKLYENQRSEGRCFRQCASRRFQVMA